MYSHKPFLIGPKATNSVQTKVLISSTKFFAIAQNDRRAAIRFFHSTLRMIFYFKATSTRRLFLKNSILSKFGGKLQLLQFVLFPFLPPFFFKI